jgi:CO/xanthine dehydrogenase FAD-binding subunit
VAGATDLVQLLQDDVVAPEALIDISSLPLTTTEAVPCDDRRVGGEA